MIPTLNTTRREPSTVPPTRREIEVLWHASNGYSNDEIASELWISIETVKTHMNHVRAKLEAHSRAHACCEALRRGLIQ